MQEIVVRDSPGFRSGSVVECHHTSRQAGGSSLGNEGLEGGLFDTEG